MTLVTVVRSKVHGPMDQLEVHRGQFFNVPARLGPKVGLAFDGSGFRHLWPRAINDGWPWLGGGPSRGTWG